MPWVIVSVMPHQPIVCIPTTFSMSGNRTAGPQKRYECSSGISYAVSAFRRHLGVLRKVDHVTQHGARVGRHCNRADLRAGEPTEQELGAVVEMDENSA